MTILLRTTSKYTKHPFHNIQFPFSIQLKEYQGIWIALSMFSISHNRCIYAFSITKKTQRFFCQNHPYKITRKLFQKQTSRNKKGLTL
ncbi:hypothetical protein SY85_12735 [Flavisolibacter tropicus]|uniref:Uncharacterized protein n=1 Tax=Flavisolibacter tropicus TaxID=1492898 RepID=A0A172TVY8_9BACT|nr:hypothetical protein SY85_12735 [Flavisolibacter tropicus]